jgi:tight adherence protein B
MRKLTTFVAALAAGVALLAGSAGAQPTASTVEITSVDPAAYPSVEAVVTAGIGHQAEAFEVLEDGEKVPFTVEPLASGSLEIMLVLDTSGSMLGAPMDGAKAAVTTLLGTLPPDVRVGIVSFSSQPTLVAAPTTDRSLLAAQIGGLAAQGETALNDAVIFATSQFTAAASDRGVIVLSDGGDTASAAGLDQAVGAAAGVRLHVIELVSDESNRAALDQLAAAGGGTVLAASDPSTLGSLYADAAAALLGQYRITYESSGHGSVPLTVRVTTPQGTQEASTVVDLPAVAPRPPVTTSPSPSPAAETAEAAGLEPVQVALIVGASGIFLALLLLGLVVVSVNRKGRLARAQLGVQRSMADAQGLTHFADRMTAAADGYLDRRNQRRTLSAALEVAGISLRPGEFVVLVAIASLVAGIVGFMLVGLLGLVALAVLVPLGARIVVGHMAERRRAKFTEQLPDTLQLLTSTLRSGYGLLQALDSVAQEAAEPARTEFRRVLLEIRVGRDLSAALRALSDRMRSQDFEWVVGAIEINREIGGDLAAVLDSTAETIRERQRVFRQMRALTAEGRLSAYILTALPIVVALAMKFVNPPAFARLTSGFGVVMLGGGCVLLLIGWLWMKKLIRIEF